MRERLGMRGPDFFIVGAAKAGTTALRAYLRRHPEIYMPAGSLNWFGRPRLGTDAKASHLG